MIRAWAKDITSSSFQYVLAKRLNILPSAKLQTHILKNSNIEFK